MLLSTELLKVYHQSCVISTGYSNRLIRQVSIITNRLIRANVQMGPSFLRKTGIRIETAMAW